MSRSEITEGVVESKVLPELGIRPGPTDQGPEHYPLNRYFTPDMQYLPELVLASSEATFSSSKSSMFGTKPANYHLSPNREAL